MFKLTRAFVVAAVISSSVLCAPIPQDVGKPTSTGQSANPLAHASSVFGTTAQDPNYQSHPTALCIVPDMAKDAGLSQGQEQLAAKQALGLCPQAKTIAVSSKSPKRSQQVPNGGAPAPPPVREPQPGAPHPVRSVNDQPPNVGAPQPPLPKPVPAAPQPHVARDLSPHPETVPHLSPELFPGAPHQDTARSLPAPAPGSQALHQPEPIILHPAARSGTGKPPKDEHSPRPLPSPVPETPQPHAARDLPRQPEPVPKPVPVPQPEAETHRPITARFEAPHPSSEAPPQSFPLPAHPATVRSIPEQPPKIGEPAKPIQGAPAPRPAIARSEGQPQPVPQAHPQLQPAPEVTPQPDTPRPHVARFEEPHVPGPNSELPHQPVPQLGKPLPTGH
ncbi:hypothetical protein RHS04_03937 [Rhizoctonia solani]|uniref:Uncharacterized protein n=1 Tax=Rhizoctonia solani TaxID=456999 RepID=A0A8H7H8P6_9AGAM|nr:hypothetical protein RHS04_03937 [Rhizoctonia solani]